MSDRLPRDFFSQPTLNVARDLLGKKLVRIAGGERLEGLISETEAYIGTEDLACHARAGRTRRNQMMWGPAGFAYVYFTYGMHWLFNIVTEHADFPAAVLIRALQPVAGLTTLRLNRPGRRDAQLTNGPAKLCQALSIGAAENGLDLCQAQAVLFLEDAPPIKETAVERSPRVGINSVPEPWKSLPWRFRAQIVAGKGSGK